jgi:hypothetical protein
VIICANRCDLVEVMKRFLFSLAAAVAVAAPALAQSDPNTPPAPIYENFGIVTGSPSPNIDALAFANYGTFTVSSGTVFPYDFQHVLTFTNTAQMSGSPRFRFDTAFRDSPRRPATSFFNAGGAAIFADVAVEVDATNIVNHGTITTGGDGLIRLNGQNIDLSRAGLEVQRLGLDQPICFPGNSFRITTTNFVPDTGIFDRLWDVHTNALGVATLLSMNSDGTVSINAPSPVGSLPRAKPFIKYTQTSPTNWFFQAVFVQVRDTNITATMRFASFPPPPQGNNPPFLSPIIKMSATESNVVTGAIEGKSIYLWDRLASEKVINPDTNLVLLANTRAATFMPSPYFISRVAPCEYGSGLGPNYTITNNIFYNNTFSNNVVTNVGASWQALVSSSGTLLPAIPGATVTNAGSRIEIEADTLDLSLARFQADGLVSIKAKDLVSSSDSVVEVKNLNYDLGSPIKDLLVKDLVLTQVPAFDGAVAVWSGFWTNETGLLVTNVMPDPMDPTLTVTNVDTNVVDILFHAMFVDNRMVTTNSVTVNDLAVRGASVLFSDVMTVSHSLMIDTERFTVTEGGRLTLTGGGFDSLTPTNAPTLSYFTNLGSISIPSHADFGASSRTLASFVNGGSLSASTESFNVDQFENSGSISATNVISLNAKAGKLDGGRISAGSSIRLIGSDFKMRNYSQSSAGLFISVTNSLGDSGAEAKNSLVTTAGFQLAVKPEIGDLLGTSVRSTAARFVDVPHAWAAADLGATTAGYSNNVALGRLEIDAAQFGKLTFSGAGANNGLYVDFLQIGPGLTNDLANSVQIDPNLVIYFADSNLPAEDLDGKFDGHLRWVKDFAGPNSTVDVLLCTNGVAVTLKVNRALRNSAIIDSDGDGTANKFDPFPFNDDALCQNVPNLPAAARITSVKLISQSPVSALLSLDVSPKQVYQVEYTTDLVSPVWQVFSAFTNTATSGSYKLQLREALPAGESQRYYRVIVNP